MGTSIYMKLFFTKSFAQFFLGFVTILTLSFAIMALTASLSRAQ